MIHIDGSQGEGGGQILRTSLSLSMVTGKAVQIDNIRAGRSKSGLMRQHLACVKAAQAVCGAEVQGAKMGSTSLRFQPGAIRAGHYDFAVGSAGSTTLILQTVLPALGRAEAQSTVQFEGGTHNDWAPSFDFIEQAFLPLLGRMGVQVELELQRHGFYPQGGGRWQARIQPCQQWQPLHLLEAGALLDKEAVASCVRVPTHVGERELEHLARRGDWHAEQLRNQTVQALGSGNMLSVRLHHEHCTEVFEQAGRLGLQAETVAKRVVKAMRRYQAAGVAVAEHLADQLLLPMALAGGGSIRTLRPSAHCRSNAEVIERFIEARFNFVEEDKDRWRIEL